MGLLDMLGGLSPEQTQGLLAAAAQISEASGPARVKPNVMGALAQGGLAYQNSIDGARRKKLEEEAAQQALRINGYKMRDAESDLKNQEIARQEAERLRQFYMTNGASAGAPAGMAGAAAPAVPGAPATAPAAGGANQGIYAQRLAVAERLRAQGFHKQADEQEAAALKFQPKVSRWEKVNQDGKVLYAPFYEDGSSGNPVPLEVAEKLEKVNLGGKTAMLNPFTGSQVTSYTNTVDPNTLASNAVTMRGQDITARGQNMTDARAREEMALKTRVAKSPTEFQGKSGIFGMRAGEADKTIRELQGEYSPSAVNSKVAVQDTWLVGGVAGAAVNKFAMSDNDQKAEQAQRDFVNAVLRQESGAAIGKDEFDNARRQYFPQPGDSKAVIDQKARNRQLAVQGLNTNAGPARMTAPAQPAQSGGWSITKVN